MASHAAAPSENSDRESVSQRRQTLKRAISNSEGQCKRRRLHSPSDQKVEATHDGEEDPEVDEEVLENDDVDEDPEDGEDQGYEEDDFGEFEEGKQEESEEEDAAAASRRRPVVKPSLNRSRPKGQQMSNEDHQPGAIIRVTVKNFITYDYAEFLPGSKLNMVIGPNGTGKSSLVNAICLGLGYHTSVLGRASTFGEFVKHGKDSATVMVELKAKKGKNRKITLVINRADNSRKFQLDGTHATQKQIQEVIRDMRIQIDNLCQFLPQDKVAEFAGLSPIELLQKTLQAAADPIVVDHQEKLKILFQKEKSVQSEVDSGAEKLRTMESRQKDLQQDVEKLREREQILSRIQDLEMALQLATYKEARDDHRKARAALKDAITCLNQLKEDMAPALESVNKKEGYRDAVNSAHEARKGALRGVEIDVDRMREEVKNLDLEVQRLGTAQNMEQKALESSRKDLQKIRAKITEAQADLNNKPARFDPAEWNRRIREKEHLIREKQAQEDAAKEEIERCRRNGMKKYDQLKRLKADLEALDSKEGQALNALERHVPDAARAWNWLREHRDEFEKEVFGPAVLTCTIKDERYSDQIQASLNIDDLTCFTAQTKADIKKLNDQFFRVMKLSTATRMTQVPLESYRPPLSHAELARRGMDGYMLDYIEGPKPVLSVLCQSGKLHSSAITLGDISEDQFKQLQQDEGITSFATGQLYYRTMRRREYGPGAVSTRSIQIRSGRFWTDQPADSAEKAELRQNMQDTEAEVMQLKEQLATGRKQADQITACFPELHRIKDELERSKRELQKAQTKYRAIPEKLEQEQAAAREKIAEIHAKKSRIEELNADIDQAVSAKAKAVIGFAKVLTTLRTANHEVFKSHVCLIEANSEVDALKKKNADVQERLLAEKENIKRSEEEVKKLKYVADKALKKAQNALAIAESEGRSQEIKDLAQDRTVDELAQELEGDRAKLEVIQAGNPHALIEFERRAAEIASLQERQSMLDVELNLVKSNAQDIMNAFEPAVDRVVTKINDAFSYNFEQINCAGQVSVHKDEDFEKWAIEIRVKFRPNEALQLLDQHRQSGGERSVSTIFYLMSLQSMAQAPFRVVDEINQGMDPRNERMVHERMVEIACHEHTSQYFLITPKLLQGLHYDEGMRVLCIASGPEMPDNVKRIDLNKVVRMRKALMAAA